ncbi:MAG: FAD-binding oxidoreductase [Marinifilaceae bacterium]
METKIELLRQQLRGELIRKGEEGYNEARKIYNGMIDKRPEYIAYCMDVADVQAAVNFCRENSILLAVRGGGHNGGGLGICDDGLVIDLSRIRYTHVDAKARTVRVGGGCQWGDVDHAAHAFGMATPTGIISTTGVGGLTLGGGLGHLSRKYGLTIDNLLEVTMVLADGSCVTASEQENSDLYWAVRGGGGNFGVVVSFLFRLHPVKNVYAGPMFWDIARSEEVLKWYRNYILNAPEDLNGFFAFLTVPPGPPFPEAIHNRKMAGVIWCFTGSEQEGDQLFESIRKEVPPIEFEHVGMMPHPVLQSMFDPIYPPGLQWYWRADFVKEINDNAVKKHVEFGNSMPTMHSTMHLYPIDGVVHQQGPNDTPWSYREANWAQVIVGVDPDPANREKITQWTKDYFDALHPYSCGGAYINFMMEEGEDRIRATYRDNYDRLVKIKTKYDPGNLFRVNQNIKPG